ncbi:MFS transporter [Streptomyces sp. NPDC002838]|uniref:MFS transporter n=1 Tax=Streptomyces sp. NPDC002838 TaxID=3154436 RepID=UPI0033240C7C
MTELSGTAGIDRAGLGRPDWAPLAVLATGQFLVVLTTSIVNVALPTVSDGLRLSEQGQAWIVNAYGLAFGALLLVGGRAADLLGRRTVLLAGLGLFAAGSVLAGSAPTAWLLITARALQGVGAAALAPAALALVMVVYPAGAARSRALAVWGAVSAVGGAAGVLLGGLLTEALGWRSVFWAPVPVTVLVVLGCLRYVDRDAPQPAGGGSDFLGAAAVTAGLVAFVLGVSGAGRTGWLSEAVLAPVGSAVVLLGVFLVVERRTAQPLLPLRLFGTGTVGPANLAMALLGAVWVAMFFFLPLYQQRVLGYAPLVTGLAQLPLAGANALASWATPHLAVRFGARRTQTAGALLLAAGLLWFGRLPTDGGFAADMLGPSLLAGAGLGIAFVRLTAGAVEGVPAADAGIAGGLVNTTRQLGGVVGLAFLSTLATARTDAAPADLTHLQALNEGYRLAFTAGGVLTLINALLIATALRRSTARRDSLVTTGDHRS